MEKVLKNVAVLIPTYRPGSYLSDCLKSINNQTLNKELFKVYICLNGEKYPYCNFIEGELKKFDFDCRLIFEENPGVSNARNVLIDNSVEDYIVFIDDDDLISSVYLEQLLVASSHTTMGISNIVSFQGVTDNTFQNYISRAFKEIKGVESSKFKTRKYYSSPCAKMIHRDMVGSKRFNIKVAKGEDSLFMALISPSIMNVRKTSKDACYLVNERVGSVTRRKTPLKAEVKTLNYLMFQYVQLLFLPRYNFAFIATRLLATIIKYFKIIKS